MPGIFVFIVRYVAILHVIWGVLLVASDTAANATATYGITHALGASPDLAGALLFSSSLLALVAARNTTSSYESMLMLLPQQVLLSLAALSACNAIWDSSFADGVLRSRYFISADQAAILLITAVHNYALVSRHARIFRGTIFKQGGWPWTSRVSPPL